MGVRLLAVTALALAATTAPAAAATVEPLKPCYVSAGDAVEERENVSIVGEGFTPGEPVDILVDGILIVSPTADAMGGIRGAIDAPPRESGAAPFTVVVRDQIDPATAVTLRSRVTDLDVQMRPRTAQPSELVRLRGRGFTRAAPVWAHYVFDDEEQRTVRLARRSRGRCGTFDIRGRQIPIDNPRSGDWTIQIDQRRRYSPTPRPVWVRVPVEVTRTLALLP
jgi:hypothetical protein